MTFKDWFYRVATEEEKAVVRRVAIETEGLEPYDRLRKRTRCKLQMLCHGRGLTIDRDTATGHLRWRVKAAEPWDEMQFGTVEEAVAFAKEEARTVADWLGSIVPGWLVLPDGKAVWL